MDEASIAELLSRLDALDSSASARDVGFACHDLAAWAGAADFKETRLHFAELAARSDPENPAWSNLAGRLCREAGLFDRAELWFERGYRLASRLKAHDEAVRALLGNGAVMKERGRAGVARRWFLRGARRAGRTGRRGLSAEARHDLLTLAAERGDLAEVVEHATAAIELYPLNNPRMPYLAHDFAFVLIRKRLYSLALPLLEAFLKVIPTHDLLPGLSTLGWAAAGCGLAHRYEYAERGTLKRLAADRRQAAASLIHLAEGACLLGRWQQSESYASRAAAAAAERGHHDLEAEATALLAAVRTRTPAKPADAAETQELQRLSRYFALRLRRWKGPQAKAIREDSLARAAGGAG
ncbi:MAG TPA: hypothetical protein VFQ39_08050 [Longimicrobium sp.]|nr:hypothetical protein [Longimicrobium sp.]